MTLSTGYNEVIPDSVYRYRQLSGPSLERTFKDLDVRTVINLRGQHPEKEWYKEERLITEKYGVKLHSLALNSQQLPKRTDLHQLVDIISKAQRPLLIHCRAGNERTGMAAAVAILLQEGSTVAKAREQVSLKYFNLTERSVGRQLLSQYETWLAASGTKHRPKQFIKWLEFDYTDSSGNLRFRIDEINGVTIKQGTQYEDEYIFTLSAHSSLELKVSGWAVDPKDGRLVEKIELLVDDQPIGVADYGLQRNDVAKALDNDSYKSSGWRFKRNMKGWSSECYDLRLKLTRHDKSTWISAPEARICVD